MRAVASSDRCAGAGARARSSESPFFPFPSFFLFGPDLTQDYVLHDGKRGRKLGGDDFLDVTLKKKFIDVSR